MSGVRNFIMSGMRSVAIAFSSRVCGGNEMRVRQGQWSKWAGPGRPLRLSVKAQALPFHCTGVYVLAIERYRPPIQTLRTCWRMQTFGHLANESFHQ